MGWNSVQNWKRTILFAFFYVSYFASWQQPWSGRVMVKYVLWVSKKQKGSVPHLEFEGSSFPLLLVLNCFCIIFTSAFLGSVPTWNLKAQASPSLVLDCFCIIFTSGFVEVCLDLHCSAILLSESVSKHFKIVQELFSSLPLRCQIISCFYFWSPAHNSLEDGFFRLWIGFWENRLLYVRILKNNNFLLAWCWALHNSQSLILLWLV